MDLQNFGLRTDMYSKKAGSAKVRGGKASPLEAPPAGMEDDLSMLLMFVHRARALQAPRETGPSRRHFCCLRYRLMMMIPNLLWRCKRSCGA